MTLKKLKHWPDYLGRAFVKLVSIFRKNLLLVILTFSAIVLVLIIFIITRKDEPKTADSDTKIYNVLVSGKVEPPKDYQIFDKMVKLEWSTASQQKNEAIYSWESYQFIVPQLQKDIKLNLKLTLRLYSEKTGNLIEQTINLEETAAGEKIPFETVKLKTPKKDIGIDATLKVGNIAPQANSYAQYELSSGDTVKVDLKWLNTFLGFKPSDVELIATSSDASICKETKTLTYKLEKAGECVIEVFANSKDSKSVLGKVHAFSIKVK